MPPLVDEPAVVAVCVIPEAATRRDFAAGLMVRPGETRIKTPSGMYVAVLRVALVHPTEQPAATVDINI